MEANHDFILVFEGVPDLTDEVADALYEAGCDDGTFMMRGELMYGAFHRVAPHDGRGGQCDPGCSEGEYRREFRRGPSAT